MPDELTYAESGVDRNLRAQSKVALKTFQDTFKYSRHGPPIILPYNTIIPLESGVLADLKHLIYRLHLGKGKLYSDHIIEGIGTKVLVSQATDVYSTAGIDAIAMNVNDILRSGAVPLSLSDNIDCEKSEPALIEEWTKGLLAGAEMAQIVIPGGEIADVAALMKGVRDGKAFHMVCSCVGELYEKDIIWGRGIKKDDAVIGLGSSGLHSNGLSLVRKVLLKQWGGKYDAFDKPPGFDREIGYEILTPTRIYVKPVVNVNKRFDIKAAVHITGDAYKKFDKLFPFNPGIGFEFNYFDPQDIFGLIEETARSHLNKIITKKEMYSTFNMGWGFGLVVARNDAKKVLHYLKEQGEKAKEIGRATNTGKIVINDEGNRFEL